MENEDTGLQSDLLKSLMELPETDEVDMEWDKSQDWEIEEYKGNAMPINIKSNQIDLWATRPDAKSYKNVNQVPYIKQSYLI